MVGQSAISGHQQPTIRLIIRHQAQEVQRRARRQHGRRQRQLSSVGNNKMLGPKHANLVNNTMMRSRWSTAKASCSTSLDVLRSNSHNPCGSTSCLVATTLVRQLELINIEVLQLNYNVARTERRREATRPNSTNIWGSSAINQKESCGATARALLSS